MARLLLVRHGATEWNIARRYCGSTDLPLSPTGVDEAEALRASMNGTAVGRVVSSDLGRALETARIVFPGRAVETDPDLREIDFGAWEGRTSDEVRAADGARYAAWLADPERVPAGGAETLAEVAARVRRALDRIAAGGDAGGASAAATAVVTHGGPIAIVRCLLEGHPLRTIWERFPRPASVMDVEWPPAEAR